MGSSKKSYQAHSHSSTGSNWTASDGSVKSQSTAPTVHSGHPLFKQHSLFQRFQGFGARDSATTYASTDASTEELPNLPEDLPVELVIDRHEIFPSEAIASTPPSFGQLFPSMRRLLIKHDGATIDGNMNLRVDTMVTDEEGLKQEVILFHLRMHDLHNRKFSLRRYCRESGREVCHSSRKYRPTAPDTRPALQRPLSTALASFRRKSDTQAEQATTASLKRHDSGYSDDGAHWAHKESYHPGGETEAKPPAPTNAILLEFSNYAHVEVKRRGSRMSKRYEYEYWSSKYQWRREKRKEGGLVEISFHLVNTTSSKTIAHIVPEPFSPLEAVEEESKGGWIPPSSMWISDPSEYEKMSDVADVIIATGLVALVDDCIKRRWHKPGRTPRRGSLAMNMDSLAPRKMMGEILNRRGSTGTREDVPIHRRQHSAQV